MSTTSGGSHVRWWVAVAIGTIVSVPFAWLLSYAGMLLFYLGLFFFALFGLVIGAVVYRIASPRRPFSRTSLVVGTSVIVVLCWAFSVVKECRDFPADMAYKAAEARRLRPGNRSIDDYHAEVQQQVRAFLRERYPPGGTVGYIRWITTSGELSPVDIASIKHSLRRGQRKYAWVIRVLLSAGLLAFGVGSQTLPLRHSQPPVGSERI